MFLRPGHVGGFAEILGLKPQATLPGLFEAARGSAMVSVPLLPRRGGPIRLWRASWPRTMA